MVGTEAARIGHCRSTTDVCCRIGICGSGFFSSVRRPALPKTTQVAASARTQLNARTSALRTFSRESSVLSGSAIISAGTQMARREHTVAHLATSCSADEVKLRTTPEARQNDDNTTPRTTPRPAAWPGNSARLAKHIKPEFVSELSLWLRKCMYILRPKIPLKHAFCALVRNFAQPFERLQANGETEKLRIKRLYTDKRSWGIAPCPVSPEPECEQSRIMLYVGISSLSMSWKTPKHLVIPPL
jgi:hypothetical protein